MRCSKCNTIIESGTLFCPECGQKLEEQRKTGKSFNILNHYDNYVINFDENQVKCFNACRRLEEQAQRDIFSVSKKIDAEKNSASFLSNVCVDIIPEIGDAFEKLVKLAVSILKENNINDISETLLWEKLMNDKFFTEELRDAFFATNYYLEKYYQCLVSAFPFEHGYFLLRKFRLYRIQRDALKNKNFLLYFRAYKDIQLYLTIQVYNRAVIKYNESKESFGKILEDLRISESENEALELIIGNALKDYWGYENKKEPGSVQLDPQTCDLIYNKFRNESSKGGANSYLNDLINSYKIISKVKEFLTKIIVSKIINQDQFEQFENNKKRAKEKFKSLNDNMIISEKIDALCQCIELDPYGVDYYSAIYAINNNTRKDLLDVAEYVGASLSVKCSFHEKLDKDNKITVSIYKDNGEIPINAAPIAYNQQDLDFVLEYYPPLSPGTKTVYLFPGGYLISTHFHGIHYRGFGNVVVDIDDDQVSLETCNITFQNVSFSERLQALQKLQKEEAIKNLPAEELYKTAHEYLEASNYEEAIKRYKLAADQNHTDSLYELGLLYSFSNPLTEQRQSYAKECFKKAGMLGHKLAALEYSSASFLMKARVLVTFNFWKDKINNLYCYPNIPSQKLKNVLSAYAQNLNIRSSDIITLYDDTFLGNAKDGFIITDECIVSSFTYNGSTNFKYGLSEILYLGLKQDGLYAVLKKDGEIKLCDYPTANGGGENIISGFVYSVSASLFKTSNIEYLSLTDINYKKTIGESLLPYCEKQVQNNQIIDEGNRTKDEGDGERYYDEGTKYLNGTGVTQNPEEALRWFIKGAIAGDALCQYNAGYIYSSDLLGAPNYEKCKYWFTKAASNGVAEARSYLEANKGFFDTVDCSNVDPTSVDGNNTATTGNNSNYRCQFCGNNLQDGDTFCVKCGKKVAISCPQCGSTVFLYKENFCCMCGLKFSYCPRCHELLYGGQTNCVKCGYKIN